MVRFLDLSNLFQTGLYTYHRRPLSCIIKTAHKAFADMMLLQSTFIYNLTQYLLISFKFQSIDRKVTNHSFPKIENACISFPGNDKSYWESHVRMLDGHFESSISSMQNSLQLVSCDRKQLLCHPLTHVEHTELGCISFFSLCFKKGRLFKRMPHSMGFKRLEVTAWPSHTICCF